MQRQRGHKNCNDNETEGKSPLESKTWEGKNLEWREHKTFGTSSLLENNARDLKLINFLNSWNCRSICKELSLVQIVSEKKGDSNSSQSISNEVLEILKSAIEEGTENDV